MTSTVLTIILNYKTADMTLRAAESALQAMEGIPGAITIVDNDSGDGSFEMMRNAVALKGWDRVRVVASDRNGGFGAGNNFGMRLGLPGGARPDYIYGLNSDAFPDRHAIDRLRQYLDQHPKAAFAGSYVHGDDGATHTSAFRFPSVLGELENGIKTGFVTKLLAKHVVPMKQPETTCPVDWISGASFMMRQDALDAIGLFDETFFLYFEETDLCLRARRHGWSVVYVHDSVVEHIGSVSTGMKVWHRVPGYWYDSRFHYFHKNHGKLYTVAATAALVLGEGIYALRRVIQQKPAITPPHFVRDLLSHHLKRLMPGGGATTISTSGSQSGNKSGVKAQ
ncbi:glycosyltransferase [Roseicitreum antarcticum]|uniref:Glycosyltransferase 2-like domain-containing protein n=1 Tax=Roseicitreum antarcticum TaxID=564137 RepID=A0A1H2RY78_9RHOB|nr:glycosyltransferase family 2 protein [Roseicitreum antarcticum]SDW24426.1 hypothetical protein SAMN04488238_101452 [Roseicitreum antarcticum]